MKQIEKLIVLDRDGVINVDSDAYIKNPDEWQPEAGSIEALVKLKKAGWTIAVATNQSGVKRGYYDRQTLSQMHQKMQSLLLAAGGKDCLVDWINYSPYTGEDGAPCRKPGTGMFQAIANRFGTELKGFPMVGDTLNDMKAAKQMQMLPYFVRTGKGERVLAKQDTEMQAVLEGVPVYDNLLAVVEELLK